MPLPTNPATPWPPKAEQAHLGDVAESDAWYSGDVTRLQALYGNAPNRAAGHPGFGDTKPGGLGQRVRFWSRRGTDTTGAKPSRQQLHVPLPADIASTSADLLFAEQPEFTIPDARERTESGQPTNPQAAATQDALDQLIGDADVHNTLLEAGEVCAALGGVVLRPVWDRDVLDHPMLTVIHADAVSVDWRYGRPSALSFWRTLVTDNKNVWRHLERHERGVILHGLYVGTSTELGRSVDLTAHPATADLDEVIVLPGGLEWVAAYVPNVRPNRKRRNLQLGRSDWQGCEGLFDALDETWTSWQRDIRLGQARIIVDQQALDRGSGRGGGAAFDPDREVYVGLDVEPGPDKKALVESVQFEIRYEEHERTAINLIERAVSSCGYSPQSFGLHIEGRAETGTALRIREAKTLRTKGRKHRYWTAPLRTSLHALQVIYREVYGRTDITPAAPSINWGDSLSDDPRETAQTIQLLDAARAASVRTKVKMAQPHLEGGELDAEVSRVLAESGQAVPDPMQSGGVP